jgi:signal transduction histidine kinase
VAGLVVLLLVLIMGTNALMAAAHGGLGAASDLVWLASFSTFAVVGGLIVRHRPRNEVGLLFLAAGLATPLASLLTEVSTGMADTGWAPVATVLYTVATICFGVSWTAVTTYPLLLFPDGRLPSRRWRPVVYAVTALLAVMALSVVAATAVPASEPAAAAVVDGCVYGGVLVSLAGIASLVVRWRRSGGTVRRQLSWLALGGLLIVAMVAVELVLLALLGADDDLGAYFEAAQLTVLPVATYVAIVRHRLFDIELVLRRSLVYALLSAAVVGAYAASLAVTSRLLRSDADVGASLVASAVVAVALSPLKDRLDRALDRALFGDRSEPQRALAALGVRLAAVASGESVLPAAAQTVRAALRLPYVSIEPLGREPVTAGEPVPDVLALDLVSHGAVEGRLLAGRRGDGEDFDPRESGLLADLARQVALVVRSARLTDDLRRSRERLVVAREQERLRLRRDLHDGLGPVLAGAILQLGAVHAHLADGERGERGAALVDRITGELRRATVDIRRVLDGLRPADLDQLGLGGVVAEHGRSLSASGVEVAVSCDPLPPTTSPAAEVAAYRIVTEALTNVVRHAGARACWVDIRGRGGALEISVADDGRGLPPDHVPGVGLASMAERADELGGTLRVRARPAGGTIVHAWLPAEALG